MTMTQPPVRKRSPIWILIVAGLVPAAIIGGVFYFLWIAKPQQEAGAFIREATLRTSGLSRPTVNKLDTTRYVDADNDLVADVPTDPSKLVDPPSLVFTYIPLPPDQEEPDRYRPVFAEFLAYLTKVTGKPAEYRIYDSLNAELKAMRDGELHVCGFNTGAVPEAVDLAGFVPAYKLATASGSALTRMLIIVPKDSPMRNCGDLKGHELTVTEPGSNSGYKAPLVLLKKTFDLEPERDYILRYSGGHDTSVAGIASKQYQAAAVSADLLQRAIARNEIGADAYRKIYESSAFPTACFGYAYNLKPELAAKIRKAFETFEWKGTALEKEFSQAEQSNFAPANFKDDWSLVREIDDQIGVTYKID